MMITGNLDAPGSAEARIKAELFLLQVNNNVVVALP